MRVAYADPPYIGCSSLYKKHPDYAGEVDHAALIDRLVAEYTDGWALSCHSPSLRLLLPLCPEGTRVAAWVRPDAPGRPHGGRVAKPVYSWEPVLFRGGGDTNKRYGLVRDIHVGHRGTAQQSGLIGAKPEGFSYWLFALLGLQPGDELVDMFPGTGAVTRAWEKWQRQLFLHQPRAPGGELAEAAP